MKISRFKFSMLTVALAAVTIFSCKDDLTEEDLLAEQNKSKLEELKQQMRKDSLDYLLSLNEFEYRKFQDSLRRSDSLALAALGSAANLPYTYNLQVINGSTSSTTNGRTNNFGGTDVTVSITQFGVKQTQTTDDGLFTFGNIGVGVIHGTISAPGFTSFNFVVDASLSYQYFRDFVLSLDDAAVGNGGGPTISGKYMEILLNYFNQRSFGNDFPIFATTGPTTSTLTGRAFIETNLTNRTKEVAPAGTQIVATIDVDDNNFTDRFILDGDVSDPTNDPDDAILNSIFNPTSWSIGYLGTAATDANGDYTITVPGSPDGLPILIDYSDVVANKTFFEENNGDVTTLVRRNVYGPNMTYSNVPFIFSAPSVSFFAGGGASGTVTISGDGSITDIDLTAGGQNFNGVPRVIIGPPPAGGTQATATATVADGRVTDVVIVNGGSGYIAAPSFTITEGTGGTATVNNLEANATNGGVANVVVTNAGSNYAVAPNVVFWTDLDGGGARATDGSEDLNVANFPTGINSIVLNKRSGTVFPAATAVLNAATQTVANVNVTVAGNAMNFAPSVIFSTGEGAAGTATIAGGVVTAVTFPGATQGRYYVGSPTIQLLSAGTPTTAATFTATVSGGAITGATFTAGAGYPAADGDYALTITPVGSGATGTVVWQGNVVGGASIANIGALQTDNIYYSTAPRVEFSMPQFTGTGSTRAEGIASLGQDGRLVGITVTNPGFGYTAIPTISLVSGSGAAATPTFANRVITEIDVTAPGNGYIVAPQILVVDPTGAGSGATAVANIQNGQVTSIDLTNAGSGYINNATVIVLDPGRSYNAQSFSTYSNPAQANVIVQGGVVTGVELYQAGDNYPAGTEVRVSAFHGSGFTATATATAGRIASVTVTNGGTGYVGNNYVRDLNDDIFPNIILAFNSFTMNFGIYSTNFTDFNFNGNSTEYNSKSGVSRVVDIEYGTGRNQD